MSKRVGKWARAAALMLGYSMTHAPLTFAASPPQALSPRDAPASVADTIAAGRLPASSVSFAVLDAESGRVIASRNGDALRSPA